DAAGEAFDKVAKYLGFGYPGGPVVDRLAATGRDDAYPFSQPRMSDGSLDFSFSGLKTAALLTMRREGVTPLDGRVTDLSSDVDREAAAPAAVRDLFASFQRAVVSFLVKRTVQCLEETGVGLVCMGGGVACNSLLRKSMAAAGEKHGFQVAWPRPDLCSDNGAMVAAAGYRMLARGEVSGLDLDAAPGLRLPG
ncbi:MAG: tRNA (adenosine(37)-N6)-threonylcarbamoyltransferase complex transferase subunit TsaD, partial [Acidobacteriota bacterium]